MAIEKRCTLFLLKTKKNMKQVNVTFNQNELLKLFFAVAGKEGFEDITKKLQAASNELSSRTYEMDVERLNRLEK